MAATTRIGNSQARISEVLDRDGPAFSFEFYPPKTPAGVRLLLRTVEELTPLRPSFVSVTYGAGGSTRAQTRDLVVEIASRSGLTVMAHVTCLGHTRSELYGIFADLRNAGVRNVLALRGDVPRAQDDFSFPEDGFRHADELIRFIRAEGFDFCIGAACYPEGHLELEDRDQDLRNLLLKVEAGAEFLITQLFFDNAYYFDFLQRARALGIGQPIIPGLMPITDFAQIQRFTRDIGATIPTRLTLDLERCETPDDVFDVGVRWSLRQCRDLLARGAPGAHFYTLNRSRATRHVLEALRQ